MKYKATLEIRTPLYKRVLRFFKLIKPREEFEILIFSDVFKPGDIVKGYDKAQIKILKNE